MEREVVGFLLRQAVPWEALSRGIAQVLGVQLHQIAQLSFDSRDIPPAVLVETHYHEGGFQLDVTLYIDKAAVHNGISSVAIAERLAKELGQDALASPPKSWAVTQNPYAWILIRSSGDMFLVYETDPASESLTPDEGADRIRKLASEEQDVLRRE